MFVWKKDNSERGKLCPTERTFRNLQASPASLLPRIRAEIQRLRHQYKLFHWHLVFPDVFRLPATDQEPENEQTGWNGGFDVVLGNPPWEKVEVLDRELNAIDFDDDESQGLARMEEFRVRKIERMTDCSRRFIRDSSRFPLCGQGRINSYSAFAELNSHIVGRGLVGCVLPPGIGTDDSTKEFIQFLTDNKYLKEFFAFTNRGYIFREIESTLSFALVTYGRRKNERLRLAAQLWQVEHLDDQGRVYTLPLESIARINPNTRNLPILQSASDALLVDFIHRRVPVLEDEINSSKHPWKSDFKQGLFNMTTKKSLFKSYEFLTGNGFTLEGANFVENEKCFMPLYEAKLTSQFNHRHGTFEGVPEDQRFGTRAQTNKPDVALLQDPAWQPWPRYWVDQSEIEATIPETWERSWFMGFRNAISAVADARSVAFAVIPRVGVGNSMPLLFLNEQLFDCLSAFGCFNSFALDYVARQKAAGGNLNFYVMKQLPILPPATFATESAVFSRQWVSSRVLELTYTAWDLEAFAVDCGYDGPPFRWDEERRFLLRCELDAAYFHLYLGTPAEWGTDSPQFREMFPTPRDAVEYIMGTFPIVKRRDIKRTEIKNEKGEVTQPGHYITKETILKIYDEMATAIETGQPYQTRLDPPPGPPTDTEGNFIPMADWDKANWPEHIHPPREEVPDG